MEDEDGGLEFVAKGQANSLSAASGKKDVVDLGLEQRVVSEGSHDDLFQLVDHLLVPFSLEASHKSIPAFLRARQVHNAVLTSSPERHHDLNLSFEVLRLPVSVVIGSCRLVRHRSSPFNDVPEVTLLEHESHHLRPVGEVVPVVVEHRHFVSVR